MDRAKPATASSFVTYLCGGINGLSDGECRDWRKDATAQLRTVVLDPMARDYRGAEDENVEAIVQGDLADIQASKYLLVNATRPSWGTAMELVYARQWGKRVVAFVGEGARVSPWLRHHSSEIHPTLEAAIAAINADSAKYFV